MIIKGLVSNITTKTKMDRSKEQIVHTTTMKVSFADLDPDQIDALAGGEFRANLLQMELLPLVQKEPSDG